MKLSDADKTDRMVGLLAGLFQSDRSRYATMWECGQGTGVFGGGYADLIVLSLWPSDGFELQGFEIKASRADLKRELANPSKSQVFAQYCHRWTLVTWDTKVVGTDTLPEGWGWWSVTPDGASFDKHVKPAKCPAPKEWPREFSAALIRRAATASPNATFTAAAVASALSRQRAEHRRDLRAAVEACHRDGWAQARGLPTLSQWSPESKEWAAAYKEWLAGPGKYRGG